MHSALLQGRIWSAVTRFTVVTLSTPRYVGGGVIQKFLNLRSPFSANGELRRGLQDRRPANRGCP